MLESSLVGDSLFSDLAVLEEAEAVQSEDWVWILIQLFASDLRL